MRAFLTLSLAAVLLVGACDQPVAEKPAVADTTSYDQGLDFLKAAATEGNYQDPALTAFAATAFLARPGGVRQSDREFVDGCLDFVVGFQKENGGIHTGRVANYSTCAAILALSESGDEKYAEVLEKAGDFVKTLQTAEGGIGYSDKNPGKADLSNTQFGIEALRRVGIEKEDPVYSKALRFLQSVQNRSESNNVEYKLEDGRIVVSLDDGGAIYKPGESKAGTVELPDGRVGLRSYGSMTYALLKCYVMAGLTAEDPRVKAVVKWIGNNFTLDENPGFDKTEDANAGFQGLYYYYFSMARALDLLGQEKVMDADGIEHEWRKELTGKIVSLQGKDGSWVNEKEERWMEGNPVLATSYALLALSSAAP